MTNDVFFFFFQEQVQCPQDISTTGYINARSKNKYIYYNITGEDYDGLSCDIIFKKIFEF